MRLEEFARVLPASASTADTLDEVECDQRLILRLGVNVFPSLGRSERNRD